MGYEDEKMIALGTRLREKGGSVRPEYLKYEVG